MPAWSSTDAVLNAHVASMEAYVHAFTSLLHTAPAHLPYDTQLLLQNTSITTDASNKLVLIHRFMVAIRCPSLLVDMITVSDRGDYGYTLTLPLDDDCAAALRHYIYVGTLPMPLLVPVAPLVCLAERYARGTCVVNEIAQVSSTTPTPTTQYQRTFGSWR
jgi:hypothetical protein